MSKLYSTHTPSHNRRVSHTVSMMSCHGCRKTNQGCVTQSTCHYILIPLFCHLFPWLSSGSIINKLVDKNITGDLLWKIRFQSCRGYRRCSSVFKKSTTTRHRDPLKVRWRDTNRRAGANIRRASNVRRANVTPTWLPRTNGKGQTMGLASLTWPPPHRVRPWTPVTSS